MTTETADTTQFAAKSVHLAGRMPPALKENENADA